MCIDIFQTHIFQIKENSGGGTWVVQSSNFGSRSKPSAAFLQAQLQYIRNNIFKRTELK